VEIHWATAWQMYLVVEALTHGQIPVPADVVPVANPTR
jgi:hypothetical protein